MNYSINILKDQKIIMESLLKTEFNSIKVQDLNMKIADLANSIQTLSDIHEKNRPETIMISENQKNIFDDGA